MKKRALFRIVPLAAVFILFFSHGFIERDKTGFLAVKGGDIIDASGRPVLLKGFNVEFKHFKEILGEEDIKKISGTGANSIRLALDYRDFESSPFKFSENSFSLLDSVLSWCEKYHVYVILDMHLAPGIQNPHDFVVHRESSFAFWSAKEYQERFYSLWAEIAERYSGKKIIAGYDLLNEGVPPDTDEYLDIINRVVSRIRSYDRNHILIVQEAIMHNGRKELFLIDDRNTIYSIHFFYPSQFTFYVTTTNRAITTYPGNMVTYGEKIGETRSISMTGNNGWEKMTVTAVPPEGAEILVVKLSSENNAGTVCFDNISLNADSLIVELPAPGVSNSSFETDYPGISWNTYGSCVTTTDRASLTGKSSLSFSGCGSHASAQSSPIEVKKGVYSLSAWYRTENASGENLISLSWHRKKILMPVERRSLLENIRYAIRFKSRHNVPLYVGEFTAHANPSGESVVNYLNDLIDIMKIEGFHWSFWEYYSEYPGIGIYTNDRRLVNPEASDSLKEHMRPD